MRTPAAICSAPSLCERNGKLVYLLTLLGRDGKVVHTTVDAGNGSVIGR